MKPQPPTAIVQLANRGIIVFQYLYETRVAPWIATWLWPLYWPFYKLMKSKQIRLVVNMGQGTGQVLPELDNFAHQKMLGQLDQHTRYVWIRQRNDFSKACVPLFGRLFQRSFMSTLLYDVVLPIQLRWHDVTHHAGLSGLRWQIPTHGHYQPAALWQTYLEAESKEQTVRDWDAYYERRSRHSNRYLLREAAASQLELDQSLRDFLGPTTKRLALIHIKENIMNATARVTDAATYLPTLQLLEKQGYQLIFVGREAMPAIFKAVDVLNYAQSPIATFRHDLQLFHAANLAITGGSGIAWIADTMGTPTVYLNSWHLFMPPFQEQCVYVPTLLKKRDGTYLLFVQQWQQYLATNNENGDVFSSVTLTPRNATTDEIQAATEELLQLCTTSQPRSPLQEQYASLGADGWLTNAQSRISQHFIEKHQNLFGATAFSPALPARQAAAVN